MQPGSDLISPPHTPVDWIGSDRIDPPYYMCKLCAASVAALLLRVSGCWIKPWSAARQDLKGTRRRREDERWREVRVRWREEYKQRDLSLFFLFFFFAWANRAASGNISQPSEADAPQGEQEEEEQEEGVARRWQPDFTLQHRNVSGVTWLSATNLALKL